MNRRNWLQGVAALLGVAVLPKPAPAPAPVFGETVVFGYTNFPTRRLPAPVGPPRHLNCRCTLEPITIWMPDTPHTYANPSKE